MAAEAVGGQEVAEGAIGGPFRQGGRSHGGQIGEEGAAVDLEETLAQDGIAGGIHGQAEMGELDFGVGGDQLEGLLLVEATQQADRNAIDPGDVGIGQQCRQFRLGEHAIEPSTSGEGEHLPAGGSGEAGRNPIPDAIGDAIAVGVAGAVEVGDYLFAIPRKQFIKLRNQLFIGRITASLYVQKIPDRQIINKQKLGMIRSQCGRQIKRFDRRFPRPIIQGYLTTEQRNSSTRQLHIDQIDQGGELVNRVHVGQASHGRLGCDGHGRGQGKGGNSARGPDGNGDAAIIPWSGQTRLGGRSWNLGKQGIPEAPGCGWMDPPTPRRAREASPLPSCAAGGIEGNN